MRGTSSTFSSKSLCKAPGVGISGSLPVLLLFCLRENKRCYTTLSFDCIERSPSTHPHVNKVHWDSFGRQFLPEISKHFGSEGFSQTSWFLTSCSLQFLLKNCEQRHHHQWPLTHQIQVAAETPNMSSRSN
jgi:hypothetical protein